VFELRTGYAQDVLPPSRHPSGVRYRWQGGAPRRRNDIPLLEGPLLRLYLEFAELKADMEAACPWTPAPQISNTPCLTPPRDASRSYSSTRFAGTLSARAVIAAFNARTRLHDLLLEYHYAPKGRGRYLMPGSTTGVAGVEVYPAQGDKPERLFSKHAACPLFDSTYKDAFETLKILKHGGLLGPALDEARALVGLG